MHTAASQSNCSKQHENKSENLLVQGVGKEGLINPSTTATTGLRYSCSWQVPIARSGKGCMPLYVCVCECVYVHALVSDVLISLQLRMCVQSTGPQFST